MLTAFLSKTEHDLLASFIDFQIYKHQGCEELYILEFLWPPLHILICLSGIRKYLLFICLLKAADTVLGLWARVQNMPISEVIQTQWFLKEDTVKDNVSQEFLGNWNDCFHVKAVLQVICTTFMFDRKEFASKVMQKAYSSQLITNINVFKTSGTFSTFLGPFPAKEL